MVSSSSPPPDLRILFSLPKTRKTVPKIFFETPQSLRPMIMYGYLPPKVKENRFILENFAKNIQFRFVSFLFPDR